MFGVRAASCSGAILYIHNTSIDGIQYQTPDSNNNLHQGKFPPIITASVHYTIRASSLLTWAPIFPLTRRGMSVWDHLELDQGSTCDKSAEKLTVFSLLWMNCRMFQARSLWLKLFQWNIIYNMISAFWGALKTIRIIKCWMLKVQAILS